MTALPSPQPERRGPLSPERIARIKKFIRYGFSVKRIHELTGEEPDVIAAFKRGSIQ